MYYHNLTGIGGSKFIWNTNEKEEFITNNVVVPFINGQVIETNYGKSKRKVLINMKASVTLSIFKTEEKIEDSQIYPRDVAVDVPDELKPFDCTSEFIEKVREIQATPEMRSLLQKAFHPPEQQVFVIMKFGDKHLDSAYSGVIKPLSQEFGLKVVRVDEIQDSGKINDQILENIAKSCLIISDLSGERPNCYYETGFAHALGKNIILTIHKASDIHFDLSSHRFIQWDTESELRSALKARFTKIFGE